MDILPYDIAEDMKECCLKASSSTANERLGSRGSARADKVQFEDLAQSFEKKSDQLLSSNVCGNIKEMFWKAAWHTANTRKNYNSDAERDKREMEEAYQHIIKAGEVSTQLADNLKWMGWNAAWFCANTLCNYTEDAKEDEARYKSHFSKITGDVNLVTMNFFMDNAKSLQAKPKVIANQNLINNSDIPQQMSFSFSTTVGGTKSLSFTAGFKYGVTNAFEVGFAGFGKASVSANFEISASSTMGGSINKGTTKKYDFPVAVPPHSTYKANGIIQEATMDVPYELVFDFGGKRKSLFGNWKGVAVSSATYTIDKADQ